MGRGVHQEVSIMVGETDLGGDLFLPSDAKAIIVFSHGSGSSRFSKRNQEVANSLNKNNYGTLMFDLLTSEEDMQIQNRFNIELLTKRLIGVTEWLLRYSPAMQYHIGYFGASTGAASALQAAARLAQIGAVVSRGGRPDLASISDLQKVKAAVLLIVGSLDEDVLQLNKDAFAKLSAKKKLVVVNGASHLFEEQGKLQEVAKLATAWFDEHLRK